MVATPARTPAQHLYVLGQLPVTTIARVKSGRLHWEGRLQPTPRSETYTVRIRYAPPSPPEVAVVEPRLEVPEGLVLPHTFPGDRLCLYWRRQWDPSMSIAKTIVPWASEWLLHYELWKLTGQWHGGGHQPTMGPKPEPGPQGENSRRPSTTRELRQAA